MEPRSQDFHILEQNINEQLGTVWCVETGHELHYSLVETNSGQLSILSPYSQHCPVVVVNRALMNIIKCCFLCLLTLLLAYLFLLKIQCMDTIYMLE